VFNIAISYADYAASGTFCRAWSQHTFELLCIMFTHFQSNVWHHSQILELWKLLQHTYNSLSITLQILTNHFSHYLFAFFALCIYTTGR